MAVSYTHLDVYKRQTYYFTQELYFEWDLYSTVINHRVIDSQSPESVLVRLREVD